MQADVLVVGAGMVGSTLALALKETGLKIVILESKTSTIKVFDPQAPFEPRVSAISLASQHVLQHVNAWSGVVQRRVSPYDNMYVWDGSGTGHIHFSADAVHQPYLGHIIENRVVQDALLEQLQTTTITVLDNAKLQQLYRQPEGTWCAVLEDGRRIRATLVVGADGSCSAVRRLVGIKTREWDYFHHAIVTSVRTEKSHQKTAWQRFTDEGPLAFLPLSLAGDEEHWCSIVWSVPKEKAGSLMALSDEAFCQVLGRAFEYRLGDILSVDRRLSVPLRQRHAKCYVQSGLAMVGDAAHVIHPLAGQGVNLGFMDAAALAETLQLALEKGASIADLAVLKRFERSRMPHNLGMMFAMEGFERLFQADQLGVRWLRNTGLKCVEELTPMKYFFVRRALGISGMLPEMAKDRI